MKLYFGTANGPQRSGCGQIGSPEGLKFFRIAPVSRLRSFGDKLYRLKSWPEKSNYPVSFTIMPILKNFNEMFGLNT